MSLINSLRKKKNLLDILALLIYSVYLVMRIIVKQTMFLIDTPDLFDMLMPMLLIVVSVARACTREKFNIVYWGGVALFVIVGITVSQHSEYIEVYDLSMLLLVLQGIEFKKIAKTFFIAIGATLLITVLSSLTGIIPNMVYPGSFPRYCLGMIYPTDLIALVFFLLLAYVMVRRDKLTLVFSAVCLVLGLCVYVFFQTKTSAILFVLLAIGNFLILWISGKTNQASKVTSKVMLNSVWLLPIGLVVMILLTLIYDPSIGILNKMNHFLTGRLYQQHEAYLKYGFSLLGQQVNMQGNGGSPVLLGRSDLYMFIDCSYINCIMRFGILLFALYMAAFLFCAFTAKRKKDYVTVLVFALLALEFITEHHMMEIYYNPLLYLLFSADYLGREEKLDKKLEKEEIKA